MILKKFDDLFLFKKKSKIKAGEGKEEGIYPFYTSSPILSKRINTWQIEEPSLVFGTGGKPSVHFVEERFATSTDCLVAVSKEDDIELNTKFVYYYLYGNIHILERGFKGAGLKHISKKYIQNIDIPVYDLETQNKIVALLDKVNTLILQRKKSITLLEELLRGQFLELFGDPVLNPNGWKKEIFKNVVHKIDSGWSPVCKDHPRTSENKWAVLKQGAVSRRKFKPQENKELPDDMEIKKEVVAEKGNILFSRKNSAQFVGATVYVYENYERLLLPDTIFKLLYKQDIVKPLFLLYLFNDHNFRRVIQGLRSGAAGSMPNISKSKLNSLEIILPDLELQQKFHNIAITIHHKKQTLKTSLNHLQDLFQSLLQKAFKGELTFNLKAELNSLLAGISPIEESNDWSGFRNNTTTTEELLRRLNQQEFEDQEQYQQAKWVVQQLLEEGQVEQVQEEGSTSLRIRKA